MVPKVDQYGNFLNFDGSIAFASGQFFSEKIVDKGHCFICGTSQSSAKFNEEHIIPQWLLTYAGIWDTKITLPNGQKLSYGRYKVKCCVACNTLLGERFERKVAPIFRAGAAEVERFVQTDYGYRLIFTWLALLHLKTSLRDFGLAYHVDQRMPQFQIGDTLDQRLLHHVHCLCSAFARDSEIDTSVFGSLLIFEVAEPTMTKEKFDFVDFHYPQTVMARIGNVAVVSCINDSGAVNVVAQNHFEKIRKWGKPLSELQLMETFSYLSCASAQMKKPEFKTYFDTRTRKTVTSCLRPNKIEIDEYDPKLMGGFLLTQIRQYLPHLVIDGRSGIEAAKLIASGAVSFYSGEFTKIGDQTMEKVESFESQIDDLLDSCLRNLA